MPPPHPFHIQSSKTASCLGIHHAAKELKAGIRTHNDLNIVVTSHASPAATHDRGNSGKGNSRPALCLLSVVKTPLISGSEVAHHFPPRRLEGGWEIRLENVGVVARSYTTVEKASLVSQRASSPTRRALGAQRLRCRRQECSCAFGEDKI